MRHFEMIYRSGVEGHGIVTAWRATELGVKPSELNRFCKDGRLERTGYGVYRLTHYVPTERTRFAEAVSLVGNQAYLYGTSALAMYGLVDADSSMLYVASKTRVRRSLPPQVRLCKSLADDVTVEYEGIPCQSAANAISVCADILSGLELARVIDESHRMGLVSDAQRERLLQSAGIRVEDFPISERPADV